jgi:hypothetical protein
MPMPNPTHPVAGRSVTDDAPTFDWTPVPDATTYRLQLAASRAFETVYYDEAVDGPTPVPLEDVLPDDADAVVWRVRTETGADASWSTPARFSVSEPDTEGDEQFLVNAPPVPIHPVREDAVDVRRAAFTWEPVPEASGYQLQVGTTEGLAEPVVDLSFDQVTSVTLSEQVPADASPLYWRVRALFPNDTSGPWSDTAVFGTDPETGEEEPTPDDAPSSTEAPSPKNSPMASGPAQHAHTSTAMAMTFVLVLVVSFVATILAVMWL